MGVEKAEGGVLVSIAIGLRQRRGHTCESARGKGDWLRLENYTCGVKGGGGRVKLHVNQALYKFSLCPLEELNRLTRSKGAPGKKKKKKNKFCSATGRELTRFKLVGLVPGVWLFLPTYGCIYLKGTAFCFLPNRHSRGQPSFSGSRKEED